VEAKLALLGRDAIGLKFFRQSRLRQISRLATNERGEMAGAEEYQIA